MPANTKDSTKAMADTVMSSDALGILCEILDSCEMTFKEMLRSRGMRLVPNHITVDGVFATIDYLNCVAHGVGNTDDIDHLGNRKMRCVGKLLQNQICKSGLCPRS